MNEGSGGVRADESLKLGEQASAMKGRKFQQMKLGYQNQESSNQAS